MALALDLHVVSSEEGGRQTPLLGGSGPEGRFSYRPNWGLPGWADGEQTAGPVLGFSRLNIRPGEDARAVIVPLFFEQVPAWHEVGPGSVLRMYEGSRVCGRAVVVWVVPVTWPIPHEQEDRLIQWLSQPSD